MTTENWSARRQIISGLILTVIMIVAVVVWGVWAPLASAVIAIGEVKIDGERKLIQHQDGGTVAEILVRDGDKVQAGDVLLRLDGALLQANLAILDAQWDELAARLARLHAERADDRKLSPDAETQVRVRAREGAARALEGEQRLFAARLETHQRRREQLTERIQQTREEISGAEAQIAGKSTELRLIAKELTALRGLVEKGHAPVNRVLALEREEARISGEVGALRAGIAQAKGRISEAQTQMLELESARRETAQTELREAQARLSELRERHAAISAQIGRLELRAPLTGTIYELAVHTVGGVVRPAEPVMALAPAAQGVIIEARVDVTAIDQIHPGLPAQLRFSAFNQRTTPEIMGKVTQVSPTRLVEQQTGIPYYLVRLAINEGELAKLGQPLVPGMPVEAMITTGQRNAVSYFLKPLTDNFARALRDE